MLVVCRNFGPRHHCEEEMHFLLQKKWTLVVLVVVRSCLKAVINIRRSLCRELRVVTTLGIVRVEFPGLINPNRPPAGRLPFDIRYACIHTHGCASSATPEQGLNGRF